MKIKEFIGSQRGKLSIWTMGLRLFLINLVGYIPSQLIRLFIYRFFCGFKIDSQVVIYGGAKIRSPENISIAQNTIIGSNSSLDGRGGITIGSNVDFSSEVAIWTVQHDPQDQDFDVKSGEVVIEDYAWISFRAVILPSVKIGEGAVVAAGAVVTKNVEPYTIVAGIPAKTIGVRKKDLSYTLGSSFFPFI